MHLSTAKDEDIVVPLLSLDRTIWASQMQSYWAKLEGWVEFTQCLHSRCSQRREINNLHQCHSDIDDTNLTAIMMTTSTWTSLALYRDFFLICVWLTCSNMPLIVTHLCPMNAGSALSQLLSSANDGDLASTARRHPIPFVIHDSDRVPFRHHAFESSAIATRPRECSRDPWGVNSSRLWWILASNWNPWITTKMVTPLPQKNYVDEGGLC